MGPTLTTSSPHRLLSIWAESSSSLNEVISSVVMGLTVSVTGTPATYPHRYKSLVL